jgi:alpha-tubulin suppressor-like RCC1 family protein
MVQTRRLAFAVLSLGLTHAALAQATVTAWGSNLYGQTSVPSSLEGVTHLTGGGWHALAARTDGSVVAWGYNLYGQRNVPAGLSGVSAVAAGAYHSVALKSDGTVVAWGAGLTNTGSWPNYG